MASTIVAGALGNCTHVAGVLGFLRVAEQLGYTTEFLGPAVAPDDFVRAIRTNDPEIVGISYRLAPDAAEHLLGELRRKLDKAKLAKRKFVFGGTPPVCRIAQDMGWFDRCFDGLESEYELRAYLKGETTIPQSAEREGTLIARLKRKHPYPLLCHHFGLPDLQETIAGVRRIAESGVADVISIAPDQNAQESFFRPSEMNADLDGAGGAPIRTPDDLEEIYAASRCGNYPLLRIFSGTRDLIRWAELATETIHNAWAAIPLCWYSVLDGRSDRTPEDAIRENLECMKWYAERGIPVEANEAHHWSLRDAHDTIAVVAAYLAALNAKAMGVRYYVAPYMFNSPPTTYGAMDLAKMLAKMELIETLHDESFISIVQIRAGLLHLSPNANMAKGQLAASTMLGMQINPHIVHVTGYCEGDHAAEAEGVIESCDIVHGVVKDTLAGLPDMTLDPFVQDRKQDLILEAQVVLDALRNLEPGRDDQLTDPRLLALAIQRGILDAPDLRRNPYAAGILQTRAIGGAIHPVDPMTKRIQSASARLAALSCDLPDPMASVVWKGEQC